MAAGTAGTAPEEDAMPAKTDHCSWRSSRCRAAARAALVTAVAALTVAAGHAPASAAAPSVEVRHLVAAETVPAGRLCPFDVTFTGEGDVRITTVQDGTRQSMHGSLEHTLYSQWVTLYSRGPAPVHIDLTTGEHTTTGMNYAFHLPRVGMVLAQAGRADSIEFRGLQKLDAEELCAALSPPL